MSAFVTETLPEDLNVLLFSQSPVLSDLFAEHLKQHGLEVTQKSSDEASLAAFIESGLSSTWYKVFWIDDVNHLSIDQAKKMIKIFQEIKGLSYVVMHQPFAYQGHKSFELIGQKLSDISVFFEQRSPYTSLLTYRDILINDVFSLNYQQIIHFLHQSHFPFTDDQIGFLNDKEVLEGIVSLSFDPRGGKRRVVVGKRPLLTKTIMKSVQVEFRRRFKGEEVLLQKELKVEWSEGFRDFPVPGGPTLEEVVSELIVEAKFHYHPEKKVEEYNSSDIPKPKAPKIQLPTISSQQQEQKSPEKSEKVEVVQKQKVEEVKIGEEPIQEKLPPPSEESIKTKVVRKPTKIIAQKTESTKNNILDNLPLEQLVPNGLKTPETPRVFPIVSLQNKIRESSIQVKVEAPLVTTPKHAPILIPEQKIPEIRRSNIILHQFSTSLEHHVPSQQNFKKIVPQVNPQIAARVHQEQQLEKEKRERSISTEEQQKKVLERKIATLFSGTLKPQKKIGLRQKDVVTPIQVLFGRETKVGKWYRAQKGIFWFCLAVSVTTLFLVGLFFYSVSSLQKNLMKVAQEFQQGSGVDELESDQLVFAQNLLDKQLSIYSKIVGTSIFTESFSELDVAKKMSILTAALNEIQSRHIEAIRQMMGAASGDPLKTLTPSLSQTDVVYKQLSLLEGELKDTDSNSFFQTQFTPDQQKDLIDSIGEIRRQVLVGQQLTQLMPAFLTKSTKKTIAVVLQDSQELRATGGFVQSVALITLNSGQVSDVHMIKPDSITAAIGSEVIPPDEVTQYLGEKQWFLRDGNWNPNFEASAKQIQFFLEKGVSTPIDGVIGVNTNSLAKIIGSLGSVSVKNFSDESITEKNFAEREFFYAKSSLIDPNQAADKPEFLSSVFQATLEKLKTIDETQTKELMTVLSDQLKQAEITVAFQDFATESAFGSLGWTGSVITPPCPTQLVQDQCLVSRIFQVDSNVGVNKVNYFIKKKVDHSIQINPDSIIHQRTIYYENSSPSNSWPGGVYKNYIRWYLPSTVKLRTITINDKAVDPSLIKQYQDKASSVVGVYLEVLPQTTAKVVIEYEEESIGKQASYAFFDQKQPGTGATPMKITIFYDPQYVPTVIAPDAQISGEKIEYSFWGGESSFAGVKFR